MESFFINPEDCGKLYSFEKQEIIEAIFEAVDSNSLITIRGIYFDYGDGERLILSGIYFMKQSEYYGYGGYESKGGWTYVSPIKW